SQPIKNLLLLSNFQLDKPVKETKTVKCLKLGKTVKAPPAGSTCVVAGWGKTNNVAKTMSDVLMSVNVTVIDRVKCNSAEYYNLDPVITSRGDFQLHITSITEGHGDSGGPLLCSGALTGVTSFGKRCGVKNKPGVYSFLTEKQLKWIKTTMRSSDI
uniref:trypsin n=1 Tax=Stegastes partitus TaxID=144197 RepID=A0A3B5B2A0_9TELE